MTDAETLSSLRTMWHTGEAMAVGWTVYERLASDARVRLAVDLLSTSCEQLSDVPRPVQRVLEIAEAPDRWREAHDAFRGVRLLTLASERRSSEDKVYQSVLYVAENAAKVIYNASGEPAPFDYDCGYWLGGCVHTLAVAVGSPELLERFWTILEAHLQASPSSSKDEGLIFK